VVISLPNSRTSTPCLWMYVQMFLAKCLVFWRAVQRKRSERKCAMTENDQRAMLSLVPPFTVQNKDVIKQKETSNATQPEYQYHILISLPRKSGHILNSKPPSPTSRELTLRAVGISQLHGFECRLSRLHLIIILVLSSSVPQDSTDTNGGNSFTGNSTRRRWFKRRG